VRFEARGDERWMHLGEPRLPGHPRDRRPLPRRLRGVESGGSSELILPVSWIYATQSWRHKGYSVMNVERPALGAGPVWSKTCIDCHNTVPYLSVALGELYGKGAPGFQGEVVDRLLPAERRARFVVDDEAKLRGALGDEISRLGGAGEASLKSAIDVTRERLTGDKLLEVGIGCESCHGGAAEHAASPSLLPGYSPRSAFLHVDRRNRRRRRSIAPARAATRCLFSRYPYTWEGAPRVGEPGGSSINSGEAREPAARRLLRRALVHRLPRPAPRRLARADAKARHARRQRRLHRLPREVRGDRALAAHSHHLPSGAGAACVGCHCPARTRAWATR